MNKEKYNINNEGEEFNYNKEDNKKNNIDKSGEISDDKGEGVKIKLGEYVGVPPPIAPPGRNARLEGPRLQVITSDNCSD